MESKGLYLTIIYQELHVLHDEVDKFQDTSNLPIRKNEDTEKLNRPINNE
jgi:hypothetical protein